MSEKKDSKKEKLKNLKKADERLKKERKLGGKRKKKKGSGKRIAIKAAGSSCRYPGSGLCGGSHLLSK